MLAKKGDEPGFSAERIQEPAQPGEEGSVQRSEGLGEGRWGQGTAQLAEKCCPHAKPAQRGSSLVRCRAATANPSWETERQGRRGRNKHATPPGEGCVVRRGFLGKSTALFAKTQAVYRPASGPALASLPRMAARGGRALVSSRPPGGDPGRSQAGLLHHGSPPQPPGSPPGWKAAGTFSNTNKR